MSGRHIGLIVEDELEMARDLGDLLDSIGHQHVHVTNAEEGRHIIDKGEVCYVLLDLQILSRPDSIKPLPEAGLSLLEYIREKYPRRNDEDMHQLPVLVVSGHAKEHYYVVKTLKDGADDFITKPVSESKPPFKEKIEEALRRAGREKHEDCAAVTREARGQPCPASKSACVPLGITARTHGKRTEIKIGKQDVPLTTSSFLLVLRLVAGRVRGEPGWVHRNDLGATTEHGWKGIARLKDELSERMKVPPELVENDKNGSYCAFRPS